MRTIAPESSQNFMQLLWSKVTQVEAPETEQQRYDRELPLWVARLEKADKVLEADSLLTGPGCLVEAVRPALAPLESVTNANGARQVKGREAVEQEAGAQENRPSHDYMLRVEETLAHIATDIPCPPSPLRRSSHPLSPSTLPVRESLPPPSPSPPARSSPPHKMPRGSHISGAQLAQRPRLSSSFSLPSALPTPAPSSDADAPPPTAKRRRKRTSLPIIASTSLITSSSESSFPSTTYSWSIVSPRTTGPLPQPRHPFLGVDNHMRNPLNVLWLAGWVPVDHSAPFEGPRRQGFLFVDGGQVDVEWLRVMRGLPSVGDTAPVWIVERSACETKGEWDMQEAVLSVF